MADENTPVFPFDTGFYNKPDQFQHFTARSTGEVIEPNAEHESVSGPAELQMCVWAEDADKAAEVYRKISEHLGFKTGDKIDVEQSVAMSPAGGRPSAYDVRFKAKGA